MGNLAEDIYLFGKAFDIENIKLKQEIDRLTQQLDIQQKTIDNLTKQLKSIEEGKK